MSRKQDNHWKQNLWNTAWNKLTNKVAGGSIYTFFYFNCRYSDWPCWGALPVAVSFSRPLLPPLLWIVSSPPTLSAPRTGTKVLEEPSPPPGQTDPVRQIGETHASSGQLEQEMLRFREFRMRDGWQLWLWSSEEYTQTEWVIGGMENTNVRQRWQDRKQKKTKGAHWSICLRRRDDGYASTLTSGLCGAIKYTDGTMYNRQDKVGLKSVSVISVRVICGTTVSRSCKP